MTAPYPDDDDGDALRRVADNGADMTRPMLVDFAIAAASEAAARAIAPVASALGYAATVERPDDPRGAWTVTCSKTMLLDYASVVAAQAELDRASSPFGGHSDGWGTFGNTEPARED